MIIKDIYGGKLSLTKTTLKEVTGERVPGDKWGLLLIDLKPNAEVPLFHLREGRIGYAMFLPNRRIIGCRAFDKTTFDKIIAAAKALKGAKKKKK